MSEKTELQTVSENEYLKSELKSTIKHEYVDGHVYAMTGSTRAHNLIVLNLSSILMQNLDDSGTCRVHAIDIKIKIESLKSYYYPDILVTCEPYTGKDVHVNSPSLIIEVLSESTKSTDRREKLIAYKKIPGLREYAIIHQSIQKVELVRRTNGNDWESLTVAYGEELILESMPNGALKIPLSLIYKGHNPPALVKENEELYEFEPVS